MAAGLSPRFETLLFVLGFALSLLFVMILLYRLWTWPLELASRPVAGGGFLIGRVLVAFIVTFYASRSTSFVLFSVLAYWKNLHRAEGEPASLPYVSILVPCFNESETIVPALESLLELDYPRYEIVVVNDGSTDDTLTKAQQFQGEFGGVSVRVFSKPNGGKWSALNFAMQRARSELLLCVDADSRLSSKAVRHLVARICRRGVAVVAGQVRVRNRANLITQIQALEYQMGNAVRMGQGLFGTVLVVPGPIGLFHRSAMEEVMVRHGRFPKVRDDLSGVGPYESDTFAEDFDLSLAILSLHGKTDYEPRAVSYTKAPESMFTLISQRYRWLRGSMQVLRKFVYRWQKGGEVPSGRLLCWLAVTYLPDMFISPLFSLAALGLLLITMAAPQAGGLMLAMMTGALLAQCCIAGFFLTIHDDNLKLLRVLPLYSLYDSVLLGSAWLISIFDEFRGVGMRW